MPGMGRWGGGFHTCVVGGDGVGLGGAVSGSRFGGGGKGADR